MEFIYYPRCSTCIKALKHLESLNLEIKKRDIVNQTPTKEELMHLINQYNQGIKPFFNTSGKVYKEMNLKNKINSLSIEEAATLLSENGMLIKRPLLITDSTIIIGYKSHLYDSLS